MSSLKNIKLPQLETTADYALDNPVVVGWTEFFSKITNDVEIFKQINEAQERSRSYATAVGDYWTQFSKFVPNFLIRSASMLSENKKRVHFVRIAYEELGEGKPNEIHSDLFEDVLTRVGISELSLKEFDHQYFVPRSLEFLDASLSNAGSDSEIIGLGLGLEAPAYENIETIFSALQWSNQYYNIVEESLFFRIHRVVEAEHIRLNIENFLKFCQTEEDKTNFLRGFFNSLEFWKMFWNDAAIAASATSRNAAEGNNACG